MDEKYIQSPITPEIWDNAKKEILKYCSNVGNDRILFNDSIGTVYKNNRYESLSLKRIEVKKSKFEKCAFIRCAATGSIFSDSTFINCQMEDNNFQYSDFSNTIIENFNTKSNEICNILGSNFSNSNFSSVKMKNLQIQGCSFVQSLFSGSILDSCKIDSCTLEGSSFEGATFKNMVLTNLNIEYADFFGVTFKNVYLPLMQLTYTFGGLDYFFNKQGLKLRSNVNQIYKDVTVTEYRNLLSYLSVYYQKEQQYFPLANIYLLFQEKNKFDEAIMLGIKIACLKRSLRDLKYFIKLIKLSGWYDNIQLRSLYFTILELSQLNIDSPNYAQEIKSHFGEIYSLLEQQSNSKIDVRFVMQENNKNQLAKANELIIGLIKEIEKSKSGAIWNNIEISRNSPVDVVISFICEQPELIISCLAAIGTWIGVLRTKYLKNEITRINKGMINQIRGNNNNINTGGGTYNNTNITNITVNVQGKLFTNENEINNFIQINKQMGN